MGNTQPLCVSTRKSNYHMRGQAPQTLSLAGPVTKDSFKILKVIGRGAFGKVFMVEKKKTKEIYAMKVLDKENILKRN